MPRMSKTHKMTGSLKKGDGYQVAYFEWDNEARGFFVKDPVGKKKYGPYNFVGDARAAGVDFYADGGKLAGFIEKELQTVA